MAAVKETRGGVSGKVVRTMWLFSWVQLVGIACSVVRTKLVAIWIGTLGIGLFGLFNTAIDTITTLTQLGIRQSPVRSIAAAGAGRLPLIIAAVRRWAWLLGIAGAFLTLVFSPLLSRLTFGNDAYTLGFIVLSVAVMLSAVTNGELAVMQGLDRLNRLARATVWGTIGGLALSVPLFYWLGEDSIVWSILAYFACQAVAVWALRVRGDGSGATAAVRPQLGRRELLAEGKEFVTLGIYMTVSVFIAMAVNYIFMAYLNFEAGIDEVGQYQAGYTVVNKYLGLIFTAIGLEFFPRISRVHDSVRRVSTFVSHEVMVAVVVILPGATLMMTLDDVIVRLLYSSEFLPAAGYLNYALAGTVFRAVSWCMAYTILARGDGRIYLLTEGASGAAFLILSYFGYRYGGLDGLGIAYSAWYGLYVVIIGVVYFWRYRMRVSRGVVLLSAAAVVITVICAVARVNGVRWLPAVVAAVSSVWAFRVIRSMIAGRARR